MIMMHVRAKTDILSKATDLLLFLVLYAPLLFPELPVALKILNSLSSLAILEILANFIRLSRCSWPLSLLSSEFMLTIEKNLGMTVITSMANQLVKYLLLILHLEVSYSRVRLLK